MMRLLALIYAVLIATNGKVAATWGAIAKPMSPAITAQIEALLAE